LSDSPPTSFDQKPPERLQVAVPQRKPIVTYILIGVTVVIYLIQFLIQTATGYDLLFFYGGKVNEFILQGQVWRLITPILLHGSFLHLGVNMYALFILGSRLERFYGHGRLLLLYLLCGFAGNALSFVLTDNPSLGASTAIFGLLAADGMFIYQNRKLFGQVRTRQALMNFLFILAINLVFGFAPGTQVDNMGHIGGLIGGIFFAWKGGPMMKIAGQAPFLHIVDDRKKNDVILASVVVFIGFAIIALIPFFTS
jgi:rhomboid protease GluP